MKRLTILSFLVLIPVVGLPSLSFNADEDGSLEVLVDDVSISAGVLVDDFSGTTINLSQWSSPPHEYAVKLDRMNDNLVMITAGDSLAAPFNLTQTSIHSPNLVSIQATITVVDTSASAMGSVSANIAGWYYNARFLSPVDRVGDIMAMVSIGDRGNGKLEAWGTILESIDPVFGNWSTATYDIITASGVLLPNTPYVARIEYNQVFDQFIFTVAGTSIIPTVPLPPPRLGFAYRANQHLSVISEGGPAAFIHATFDDLTLGNRLVDDFSSSHLDRSIWDDHSRAISLSSRIYPTAPGKLLLLAARQNITQIDTATTAITLSQKNPDRIEARVAISSDSSLGSELRGQAKLDGVAYNASRDGGFNALPYQGCDEDVAVTVQLILKDGELYGDAFAGTQTSLCQKKNTYISQRFIQPIAFDTEYLLWIEHNGNRLTLGLDNEQILHTIQTPIYPPNFGYRKISAHIEDASPAVDSEGDGDHCFIATAAYGSYLDPNLKVLRDFRDSQLLTNSVGTGLVNYYYRYSPPIADYLREHETHRAIVRSLLAVAIYVIKFPVTMLLILLLSMALVVCAFKWRTGESR